MTLREFYRKAHGEDFTLRACTVEEAVKIIGVLQQFGLQITRPDGTVIDARFFQK